MTEFVHLKDIIREPNSVVTVGTFDGVHEGHRALVETVVKKAKARNARSVVVTFDPHPREIISPGSAGIKMLTTLTERKEILDSMGINDMVVIPFNRDFSLLTSEEFIKDIVFDKIGVSEFVIGYDHHFGRDRTGTIETVERLGKEMGFSAYVVSKREMGDITISSTTIRKTLQEDGNVEQAALLLGRPYLLNGLVIHGAERGRKMGFRTANLKPEQPNKVIPKDGVYAVKARVMDKWYNGMLNIGNRPTFSGNTHAVEVHMFDFDNEIYGQTVQIHFIKRLRDEMQFSGKDELKAQLVKDKEVALRVLEG
ncbi:MAG: bifunctional riboflavin kinase/FAD synthetase [Balneolaceae bacterium]